MQSGLPAVAAPGGEKTAQAQQRPRTSRLQPVCRRADGHRLDIAFDLPQVTRFDLFRAVTDQAFEDRYPGGSEA